VLSVDIEIRESTLVRYADDSGAASWCPDVRSRNPCRLSIFSPAVTALPPSGRMRLSCASPQGVTPAVSSGFASLRKFILSHRCQHCKCTELTALLRQGSCRVADGRNSSKEMIMANRGYAEELVDQEDDFDSAPLNGCIPSTRLTLTRMTSLR
jgi:hypothetical protein